jgi:WD40 repeat protein
MFGAQAQQGGHNPNKDVQVATPLGDSVSSLAFSPRANLLVATCWDNNVYCWDIQVGRPPCACACTHGIAARLQPSTGP